MEELPRNSGLGSVGVVRPENLPTLDLAWSNEPMQSSNASDSMGQNNDSMGQRGHHPERRELDRDLGRALTDALSDILAAEKPRSRRN